VKISKKGKKPLKYAGLKPEHQARKYHIHKIPAPIFSILSKRYYPTQLSTDFNPEHAARTVKRHTKRAASETGTWMICSGVPTRPSVLTEQLPHPDVLTHGQRVKRTNHLNLSIYKKTSATMVFVTSCLNTSIVQYVTLLFF